MKVKKWEKSHQNLFEKSDLLDTHKSCYLTVYDSMKEWRSSKIMTDMEKRKSKHKPTFTAEKLAPNNVLKNKNNHKNRQN